MYPRAAIDLEYKLPPTAQFWTPEPEDIDEYLGFGFFGDVWTIVDVSEADARAMFEKDQTLCLLVSGLAANESEFEALANSVETGVADEEDSLNAHQLEVLAPYLTEIAALEGLEIGVAGLVYALSASGMYPAASCRGHSGPFAWSPCPVVFFALDRAHAEILQVLVRETGCGFQIDPNRPEMLAVVSQTIEGTLSLAAAILDRLSVFNMTPPA